MDVSMGLMPSFKSVLNLAISIFLLITFAASQSTLSVSSTDAVPSPSPIPITGSPTSGSDGTPTSFEPRFTVPSAADIGATLLPNSMDPQAKDAQAVCPGYNASDVVKSALGFSATLTLAGAPCNVYGNDIETLNLTVEYQSVDRLAVRITPAVIDASNQSHYLLNEDIVPQPKADSDAANTIDGSDLSFTWSNEPTFSFTVYRVSTGDALFDTAGTKLVYEDQFIEFVSTLPENYNLYGLGEVIHGLRLGNNFTRTIYAADIGDPIDANIYGSHPFYMDTRYYEIDSETGNKTLVTSNATNATSDYISYSHGVFNRNAHGQEILLRPSNITWRLLGGSIDMYVYAGPTQPQITSAYQMSAIGLPPMQQYFTFGFHQCRWGYSNWSQLQEVVDNYEKAGIPLENIWTDIDYMKTYRNFDNDPIRFSYDEGEKFLSALHASGRHYIPIIDSAIYVPNPNNASDNYTTFHNGNATNSFITNADGSLYIGDVWPGYTVFPDWMGDGAGKWWTSEMTSWHSKVAFDGAWIDMSEASSFCIGSCGSNNLSLNPVHPPFGLNGEPGMLVLTYPEGFNLTNATEAASASSAAASQSSAYPMSPTASGTPDYRPPTVPTPGVRDVNYPPYVINNVNGELAVHAISPNATHADGTQEYDIHNLFGHQILNATYHALLSAIPGLRPFIIGRSTFAGSGKWAGHWGGDNTSLFAYMFFSIPQALAFSLFGIPMFGVDTCGFNGNSDEELCNRWMQLSAFFPFYRNHNTLAATPQEAYIWPSVAAATRSAMTIRYQLLPYMYTLFHHASTRGDTVMRALAWEFPHDPALAAADRQFFLGPAVLVTPVLDQGATSVDGVFPGAGPGRGGGEVYYDWYTQEAVDVARVGENKTIEAPLGHIPVFLRGGYVLPVQEAAMTTREARETPWGLIVALGVGGGAGGGLYVDDGESVVQGNGTLFVSFTASNSALHASPRGTYPDRNPLANVTVLGVQTPVASENVTWNGKPVPSGGVNYNETSKVLSVTGLRNLTAEGAWGGEWVLRWG